MHKSHRPYKNGKKVEMKRVERNALNRKVTKIYIQIRDMDSQM